MYAAAAATAASTTTTTMMIEGMRLPVARAIFLAGSGASPGCEQTRRVLLESYSDIFPSSARGGLIIRYNEVTMGSVTHDGRTHVRTYTQPRRAYTIYALPMHDLPDRQYTYACARTHTTAGIHSRVREWKSAHAACPPFASSASPYLIV